VAADYRRKTGESQVLLCDLNDSVIWFGSGFSGKIASGCPFVPQNKKPLPISWKGPRVLT
jgi:hypothetical protein